jgi:hypothetical protein
MRGGRGCGASANENNCAHHVTWCPNKLWRSNSVFNLWSLLKRRQGKRGNSESRSALLAGEYTTTLLMMVILSPPMLLYPRKIFRQRNKKVFSCYDVFSAFYNNVFEALNLKIFSRNPATWQYHSASLHTTEFYTQSSGMACHWRLPSRHMNC